MQNISYEQFEAWCKHWNYTIEEGFRAMCFTSNVIGQYYGNYVDYAKGITNNDNYSDAFKSLIETKKEDMVRLVIIYEELNKTIFEMLERHEKESSA